MESNQTKSQGERERMERSKAAARQEPTAESIGELEAIAREWVASGADEPALAALGELIEEGDPYPAVRAQKALRRASEIAGGQRLCAALLVGPFPPGAGVGEEAMRRAEAAGFRLHERLFSAASLGRLPFSRRGALAKALERGESALEGDKGVAPKEIEGGFRAVCALAMLPGIGRGSWDEAGGETKRLALESLREIAEGICPEAVAVAAGELDEIVSRRDRLAGPSLLAALTAATAKAALTDPSRMAASASLHRGPGGEEELWRVGLRARKTGFLLGGMDVPLDGADPDEVFGEIAMSLAATGMERIYRIEGIGEEDLCPVCRKPVYPTPDDDQWKAALLEAGMPVDGSHPH